MENYMVVIPKSGSPFYPGQPVPVEFFAGRADQIDRIMTRGAGQVAGGKPIAMFIQGEYGIGKSSVAKFTQWWAENKYGLYPIYVPLGGCADLSSMAEAVMQSVLMTRALDANRMERIRNWLSDYIEKIELFGVSVKTDALKNDASRLSTPPGMLGFLGEVHKRLEDTGVKGVYLVFDEINGITSNSQFAHFIKGLVDSNAMSKESVPLLLVLCGVEEKRREMIRHHQPVERIFDVVEIGTMSKPEMRDFFERAFKSVLMTVDKPGMDVLTDYSAGFPKIMHLLGDVAYWLDKDGVIDEKEALQSVIIAADEVGKRYVDQQVYKALRSKTYHSILSKIAKLGPSMSFTKSEVDADLTNAEKSKFDNFLQRMKKLKVLRHGEVKGEWIFNSRMVRIYIWLQSRRKN